MASTNEELPPPKPRASPLDYRNTDLVSRLLAATPPYLYNMPLVPHSFFFSEMLRSLVQAKSENNRVSPMIQHHRRSRKRPWTQNSEFFQKEQAKMDKREMPPPSWTKPEEPFQVSFGKEKERPLDLITDKTPLNNNTKPNYYDSETKIAPLPPNFPPDKHPQFTFPQLPPTQPNSDVILPPPPPVWYPPLYPTPYGIDPLHFFIDLRVSGHIYDRKNNQKDPIPSQPTSTSTSFEESPPPIPNPVDIIQDSFKQSRHSSAFSVPSSLLAKNSPMNLTNYPHKIETKTTETKIKFDVKSMGFDKSSNKTSTNYIMNNISRIYKEIQTCCKPEPEEVKEEETKDITVVENEGNEHEETEEEREKRVRDLRALIGLELVVDYMNHAKPGQPCPNSEDSLSEDVDSNDSTAVDVVAVQDDIDVKT